MPDFVLEVFFLDHAQPLVFGHLLVTKNGCLLLHLVDTIRTVKSAVTVGSDLSELLINLREFVV
jgi:hypothetical protein